MYTTTTHTVQVTDSVWCVVFCSDCVFSGVHKLPVYEGTPTDDVLRQLSQSALDTVLEEAVVFSDGHVRNDDIIT